jgi:hypothetical protein
MSKSELIELLLAADYLSIAPLIELCCARLSRLLMNRTPEEVLGLIKSRDDCGKDFELLVEERLQLLLCLKWSGNECNDADDEPEPVAMMNALHLAREHDLALQHGFTRD